MLNYSLVFENIPELLDLVYNIKISIIYYKNY